MTFPNAVSLITLGVEDVETAAAFYERLGWQRSAASVAGDVAFFTTTTGTVLALWGREELAADAGRPAPPTGAFGGVALAINCASREEVDAALAAAVAAGGTVTKPAIETEWGGYNGYVADPAGNAWELAHNPFWPLDDAHRVTLP